MFLFSLFFVRPGFYHIEIGPKKEYTVDLENSTAFVFRDSFPGYDFTAKRGYLQSFTPYVLNESVEHFSISQTPLIMKSKQPQKFTQWILPSTLCRSRNFIHNFGYSFKYSLDSTKFTTSCLFFSSSELKHVVTMHTDSRDNVFTAKFVTDRSLNSNSYETECINATVCSVTMTKPFFIRLSMSSKRLFNLSIWVTTVRYPVRKQNCSAEAILELEEARTSKPLLWEKVNSQICKNTEDDVATMLEPIITVIVTFFIAIFALWVFNFINIGSILCMDKQDARFNDLKEHSCARVVENPIDKMTFDDKDSILTSPSLDNLEIRVDSNDIIL